MINPVTGNEIDASDKGYSFANFWRIDEFDWGTVRGRTYNYPFSEGDVPEGTFYVRLFFGLKGNGTLWLDNIVYRYSKWNFSTLERFRPYFQRRPPLHERILPTPKQFRRGEAVVYCRSGECARRPPVVVMPADPAPAERTAAGLLQESLNRGMEGALDPSDLPASVGIHRLRRTDSVAELLESELIFSIGRSRLYEEIQPAVSLPDHAQGYIVACERIGACTVVFLLGVKPVGSFYAAATAVQLLEPDRPVFHTATVVDYPDFSGRSFLWSNWHTEAELQQGLDRIASLRALKFNRVYVGNDRRDRRWWNQSDLYVTGVRQAGKMVRDSGVMQMVIMVNPYTHFPVRTAVDELDEEQKAIWDHASPQSFAMLQRVYRIGLDAGAGGIMLLADDFLPHAGSNPYNYALYNAEDRRGLVNLQNAQAHVINRLKHWLDESYPGTGLEFCPPWYCNEFVDRSQGRAEVYFEELCSRIPAEVAILWTGPTIRSLSVDMADLQRFRQLIDREPRLWDNTLYARSLEVNRYGGYTTYYPGKVRMCNLLEPFDTYKPKNFHRRSHGGAMYINGSVSSEIFQIKYATVADYLWNTSAYDPERSLWTVLCDRYGPDFARRLIVFNDAYYGLYETCRRMELDGAGAERIRRGERQWQYLEAQLRHLAAALSADSILIEELAQRCEKQRQRLRKLSGTADSELDTGPD